jgi:hypothetical protein
MRPWTVLLAVLVFLVIGRLSAAPATSAASIPDLDDVTDTLDGDGSAAHRACLAAAERVQRLGLTAAVACEQAGLSARRVRGERRSDRAACVLTLAGFPPAQPPQ